MIIVAIILISNISSYGGNRNWRTWRGGENPASKKKEGTNCIFHLATEGKTGFLLKFEIEIRPKPVVVVSRTHRLNTIKQMQFSFSALTLAGHQSWPLSRCLINAGGVLRTTIVDIVLFYLAVFRREWWLNLTGTSESMFTYSSSELFLLPSPLPLSLSPSPSLGIWKK